MKKKLLFSLVFLFCAAVFAHGELFRVNFDDFTATPDIAQGDPKSISFPNPDLQLRMFPGAGDGKKNGLSLHASEHLSYNAKDNLNLKQGTISLWVSPHNWSPNTPGPIVFFGASNYEADHHYSLLIYKAYEKGMCFYYMYKTSDMAKDKTLVATRQVDAKKWSEKTWHKMDAVWDSTGMKLYIDGELHAEHKFSENENVTLPDFNEGIMELGARHKWSDMDKNIVTGFDDFVIYSRCLTPQEIRTGYEAYYPKAADGDKESIQPVITIPQQTVPVALDGKIGEDEWKDAAKVPVDRLYPCSENRKPAKSAWAWVKYDQDALWVAMASDRKPAQALAKDHDSLAWQDDCFEVHLNPPKGDFSYQYVLNSNNAIFDIKNPKAQFVTEHLHNLEDWNGTAATAVDVQEKSWTAEWRIPFSDMGYASAPEGMKINFAYLNCEAGKNQYSWGFTPYGTGFGDEKNAGLVNWGQAGEGVRLESFGKVSQGNLSLALASVNKAIGKNYASTAKLLQEGAMRPIASENILDTIWTMPLPTGRHLLNWECKKGDKIIARGQDEFELNKPLELSFECHGERWYVDVKLDMNNSGSDNLGRLYQGGLEGTIAIVSIDGIEVSAEAFLAKDNPVLVKRLQIPKDIASGKYNIVAKVNGMSAAIPFTVPSFEPFKAKLGRDHTVPSPWCAVTGSGKTWQVLNRTFLFDKGPMPSQVINQGEAMFEKAPSYSLSTEKGSGEIKWSDFQAGKNHGDFAEFSGTGVGNGLKFGWKGELWFDGTYKWILNFEPETGTVLINHFMLNWKQPAKFSKYVLTPVFKPWEKNGTMDLEWDTTTYDETSMVWLLGSPKGISWWNMSDANWSNNPKEKQIHLEKDGNGAAEATVKMITAPARLGKRAQYTMTFTITPQRPVDRKFQDFELFGKDVENAWRDYEQESSANSHEPASDEGFARGLREAQKRGTTLHLYACPFYLDSCLDEYKYYYQDWKKRPIQMFGTVDKKNGGVPAMAETVCSSSNLFDLYAWRTRVLFEKFPTMSGIYYDCAHCPDCSNEEHGCGGIDAFGKRFVTSTAWFLRDNMIRSLKIHRQYSKVLGVHGHNKFNPLAHSFADWWLPGEEYTVYPNGMSPVFLYCDMQDEWLQAAYNADVRGTCIIILPEPERSKTYVKDLNERLMADGGWEQATYGHITPFLLHGTNICPAYLKEKEPIHRWWKIKSALRIAEAEFVGYWYRKVITTTAPRVYASWYKWSEASDAPYKRLIILGNLNRTRQEFQMTIDKKAFGIEGKRVEYIDLWNGGKPLSEAEFQHLSLESARFHAIGVRW